MIDAWGIQHRWEDASGVARDVGAVRLTAGHRAEVDEALVARRVARLEQVRRVVRTRAGFRMVLHHTSEAFRVADEIAAADVPVSLIIVDSPGGKLEALYLLPENAPALEQAGVKVAFHTDDWITDSRYFLRMAALGVRAGMSRETALAALTTRSFRPSLFTSPIDTPAPL